MARKKRPTRYRGLKIDPVIAAVNKHVPIFRRDKGHEWDFGKRPAVCYWCGATFKHEHKPCLPSRR